MPASPHPVIVHGWVADTFGLQRTFLLTAACAVCVTFYALRGSKAIDALSGQHVE